MFEDKKENSDKWNSYNAQSTSKKIPMAFKAPQNMLSIQLNFGITQL